jgi:hypothetical protein
MTWHDGKDDPISWFFQNLDKPNFNQTEVLVLAGERLKAITLQNWTNRQYVKPKKVGGKRRYSALEVASIALAQPLVWNLSGRSTIALPLGDVQLAVVTAEEAVQLSLGAESTFHAAEAAAVLAASLLEAGQYIATIVRLMKNFDMVIAHPCLHWPACL